MGGPDMAPQFRWGPRHGPQTPNARSGPGNPCRSSTHPPTLVAPGRSRGAPRFADRFLFVHRPVIQQAEPAGGDAVDEPEADDAERDPRDEDADAERGDDEQHAQPDPQRAEPERADLPAEVRLEPRAAHLAPLRVIEDDGDDRGPAEEKGAHDGGHGSRLSRAPCETHARSRAARARRCRAPR